jgi:GTPase SAR1 family protein
MPKIRAVGKDIPIILVGTQSDLRNATENGHISVEQGQKIAKIMKAEYYLECSAKTDINIREVFEKTAQAKIRHSKKKMNIIKRIFNR